MLEWLWQGSELWWRGAWGSVLLPAVVSGYVLVRNSDDLRSAALWTLVALCFLTSALTGEWRADQESISLHLLPVFFIAQAVLAYRGHVLPAGVAFVGCFSSLLAADVTHAVLHFGAQASDLSYLQGIGGAGLQDGLFMFPVLSATLSMYSQRRQPKPTLKTCSL